MTQTANPPRSRGRVIVDAMITALKAIHTDNGDSFTPVSVQRLDRNRSSEGQSPAIMVSTEMEPKSRGEADDTSSPWQRTLTVMVRVYLNTAGDQETASDEDLDEAWEDVFRAVTAMDWQALQADPVSFEAEDFTEIEDEPGTRDGFEAQIRVDHKTAYNNPDIPVF